MKNIENVACKAVIAYTIIDSIAMTASIIMAHNARKALQAKKPEKRQDDQLDGIRAIVKQKHGAPVDFRAWSDWRGRLRIASDGERHPEMDAVYSLNPMATGGITEWSDDDE